MVTSIIFDLKILPALRTALFLLFVSVLEPSFAQTITPAQHPESTAVQIEVTGVADSSASPAFIIPKSFSVNERAAYYRKWQDQFPSPLIMHFNGIPEVHDQDLPLKRDDDDWKFWLSLILLVLLAGIRFGYARDFEDQMNAFRNWGVNQQVIRELGVGVPFGVVLLNVFSAMVFSFYAYCLIEHFGWVRLEPAWLLMAATFALVASLMFLRYLLLKTAELVSRHGKELRLYTYYELQINRVAGIFLYPVLLLSLYTQPPLSDYALYVSYALLAAYFLMRFVKEFNLSITYFGNHVIHFLLYICALEIAPLLIVIRLLSNINPVRFSV